MSEMCGCYLPPRPVASHASTCLPRAPWHDAIYRACGLHFECLDAFPEMYCFWCHDHGDSASTSRREREPAMSERKPSRPWAQR